MDLFNTEREMLIELDNFIFKCKGLHTKNRNRLIYYINEFLKENNLIGDQHSFVNIKEYK